MTWQKIRHYVLATLLFVKLGYTYSWNSDLNIKFVLGILTRYVHVFQWFEQWINQTLCVRYSAVLIMGSFGHSTLIQERLIEQWFKKILCVRYFTKIHSGFSWFDWSTKQTLCGSYFTVCKFGVNFVMEQWFNQWLCVSYFIMIHSCIK